MYKYGRSSPWQAGEAHMAEPSLPLWTGIAFGLSYNSFLAEDKIPSTMGFSPTWQRSTTHKPLKCNFARLAI
jgi:hypothetical protein